MPDNYRSYDDRNTKRNILFGSAALAGLGAAVVFRKKIVKFGLKGIESFIDREVGGLTTKSLGGIGALEEQHFRPAARIAEEISSSLSSIETRARQSHSAGFLFDNESLSEFRTNWGEDNLRNAVGVGRNKENQSITKYQKAFGGFFDGNNAPDAITQHYDNLALSPQFQEALHLRATSLAGGAAVDATHQVMAQEELARALQHANAFGANVAKEGNYQLGKEGKQKLLGMLDEHYLQSETKDTTNDTILSFFGIEKQRLSDDSSFQRARDILIEGHEDKSGVLNGLFSNPLEAEEYLHKIGQVKTGKLLKVDGEEFDLSALPTALSSVYKKLNSSLHIPISPGTKGLNPFSLFPFLKEQPTNIINEIPATARMPFLDSITHASTHPDGHPGSFFVVGKQQSSNSFSGHGQFIGDGLIHGADRSAEQALINDKLKDYEIDLRSAKKGLFKTINERATEAVERRAAKAAGESREKTSIVGRFMERHNLSGGPFDTFRKVEQKLSNVLTPGGRSGVSIWEKIASVKNKFSNDEWLPNVYKKRILESDTVDSKAMSDLFGAMKTSRSGYIDPEDIADLIHKDGTEGLLTNATEPFRRLMTEKGKDGKALFLSDKEVLGFFSNHDIDLKDIKTDHLRRTMQTFRKSPEHGLGFNKNNNVDSIFDDLNINYVRGLKGGENSSEGVQHLREALFAEMSRHGESTGKNLFDRITQSGLSKKKKTVYSAFVKGHDLSQGLSEDSLGVFEALRGKSKESHQLRGVIEDFLDQQIHPLSSFVENDRAPIDEHLMPFLKPKHRKKQTLDYVQEQLGTKSLLNDFIQNPEATAKHVLNNKKKIGYALYNRLDEFFKDGESTSTSVKNIFAKGQSFDERVHRVKNLYESAKNNHFVRKARAFTRGFDDPESLDPHSIKEYFFAARLNDQVLAKLGLGLGKDDLSSTGKMAFAIATKRILPAYLGIKLIDRLHYDSEQAGLPTPEELGANLKAKSNLATRGLFDKFNVTSKLKRLQKVLPGSKTFLGFNPSSKDEYKSYLDHERDPVRRNKGWLFGSRSAFVGDNVSHFEPNYYLKAHSKYRTAQGGDRAKESFNVLDPYAQEKANSTGDFAARPYPVTAPLMDPDLAFAPLINNTIGKIIKPQKAINKKQLKEAVAHEKNRRQDTLSTSTVGGLYNDLDYLQYNSYSSGNGSSGGSSSRMPSGGSGSGSGGGFRSGGTSTPYSRANKPRGKKKAFRALVKAPRKFGFGVSLETKKYEAEFGRDLDSGYKPTSLVTLGNSGNFKVEGLSDGSVPTPYGNRYFGAAEPGISLSRKQVARLNRKLAQMGTGLTRLPNMHQEGPDNKPFVSPQSFEYQKHALEFQEKKTKGIYNTINNLNPFHKERPFHGKVLADASSAYGVSNRFENQSGSGLFPNLIKKLVPGRDKSVESYNPLKNQFYGSDWLPGENSQKDFQTGDPYSKIQGGTMRLPGEAYRRLYRTEILSLRASSAGRSAEEMADGFVHKKQPFTDYGEYVTSLGTKLHARVESKMKDLGFSILNEAVVGDRKLGIKGHIDLILRTERGVEIADLKTVSDEKFDKIQKSGKAAEEHMRQIAVYQHLTGIKRGRVIYASRDSERVMTLNSDYSSSRFKAVTDNLHKARKIVMDKLNNQQISEADLYDDTTKYEILSDVAPGSAERKALGKSLTASDQLSSSDKQKIKDARERVAATSRSVETFDYKFAHQQERLQTKHYKIDHIEGNENIYVQGQNNPIRLAGGKITADSIHQYLANNKLKSPKNKEETQAEYFYRLQGISKGKTITVRTDKDKSLENRNDSLHSQRVVLGDLNRKLIDKGAIEEDEKDNTPTGVQARFSKGERTLGNIWERFAHLDTPLHTKFLKVRSPLEAYKRQVVYGATEGSLSKPFSTYIGPTISGIADKNPISAALMGAFVATLPFALSSHKGVAALVGAGIGASLSLGKMAYEGISRKPLIPKNLKKRREIDEYFDVLKYVKERSLFEKKSEEAKRREGVDVKGLVNKYENLAGWRKKKSRQLDAEIKHLAKRKPKEGERKEYEQKLSNLRQEKTRLSNPLATLALGPLATQALQHRDAYRKTLYGAGPDTPLMSLLGGMAKNERDIISDSLNSSDKDKKKLYNLLSNPQKRVLGYKLGIAPGKIPERPTLNQYFKNHQLPGADSAIWDENVSIDDLKTRAYGEENFRNIELGVFPQTVEQAEERTQGISVPDPRGRSKNVQNNLNRILSGQLSGQKFFHTMSYKTPSWADRDEVRVKMNVKENRRQDVMDNINERY